MSRHRVSTPSRSPSREEEGRRESGDSSASGLKRSPSSSSLDVREDETPKRIKLPSFSDLQDHITRLQVEEWAGPSSGPSQSSSGTYGLPSVASSNGSHSSSSLRHPGSLHRSPSNPEYERVFQAPSMLQRSRGSSHTQDASSRRQSHLSPFDSAGSRSNLTTLPPITDSAERDRRRSYAHEFHHTERMKRKASYDAVARAPDASTLNDSPLFPSSARTSPSQRQHPFVAEEPRRISSRYSDLRTTSSDDRETSRYSISRHEPLSLSARSNSVAYGLPMSSSASGSYSHADPSHSQPGTYDPAQPRYTPSSTSPSGSPTSERNGPSPRLQGSPTGANTHTGPVYGLHRGAAFESEYREPGPSYESRHRQRSQGSLDMRAAPLPSQSRSWSIVGQMPSGPSALYYAPSAPHSSHPSPSHAQQHQAAPSTTGPSPGAFGLVGALPSSSSHSYAQSSEQQQQQQPTSSGVQVDAEVDGPRRGNYPRHVTEHLKKWLFAHREHPYPTDHEKRELARYTNLSMTQLNNWLINARRRLLRDTKNAESGGSMDQDD
ncbi:Homeobox protein tos8 [Tilletia horrida]|uniref:Homeobox protein tos8 n=1 Tax=Tilletia horrida TaxID=155126 RepID=A0AAN6GLR5_9BASI|nr:Homeobox protein tos8 [Tilletia horrida]KAK0559931.1 Homeobox protein tos8 [Tilletia horrida]